MSLVVISGKPSCGKSKVASSLKDYLNKQYPDKHVVIVTDEGLNRNEVYSDSRKEITYRGAFKSSVERALSKRLIVIADSLNYIKGELFGFLTCRKILFLNLLMTHTIY